jgi:hypothetical protein
MPDEKIFGFVEQAFGLDKKSADDRI